jgi:hypothetical protein
MNEETKIPNNAEIDKALREFEMQKSNVAVAQAVPEPPKAPEASADLEIAEALKEFEAKSGAEEVQPSGEVLKTAGMPKMVVLVIKYSGGAVKDQRTAEYILLALTAAMFALSFYFFFRGSGNGAPQPSPAQLNQMQNIMPMN